MQDSLTLRCARYISSIPNLVGRTIEGTFEVLEVLGTGGYGVVFRAVDIHSPDQQQYAIKCMLKGAPHSRERHVQCWERYIHLQVNDYPNIVRLHKTIDCGDFVCLVFDIVQGGDLFSHVTEKGTFYGNDELVRTAFIQLIDAIAHCHSKGVYHRDLKLENVLCSRDGSKMFLTDFGLAMLGEWSSKIGVGSIFYMSPESIGREYHLPCFPNASVDIWALGIILTNMVTGRSPWRVASPSDRCFSDYLLNPDYLRLKLPVSAELCTLLRRIFVCNPLARPSLHELRSAVVNMKTFFLTAAELASSSDALRSTALSYQRQGMSAALSKVDGSARHQEEVYDPRTSRSSSFHMDVDGSSIIDASPPESFGTAPSWPITPENTTARDLAAIAELRNSLNELAVPGRYHQLPARGPLANASAEHKLAPRHRSFLRRFIARLKSM